MGKILAITEKIPAPSTLPNGTYTGIWGGYVIEVSYMGKNYQLTTDEGVRGFGFKVVVKVENGKGSFVELKN